MKRPFETSQNLDKHDTWQISEYMFIDSAYIHTVNSRDLGGVNFLDKEIKNQL